MAGRFEHMQLKAGYYQEQVSVGNDLSVTWGTLTPLRYRSEDYTDEKGKWARRQGANYTELSINIELDPYKTYRIWLEGKDTGDSSQAIMPDTIRPVYGRFGEFVHTVVGL
jgi:hypothetical protein